VYVLRLRSRRSLQQGGLGPQAQPPPFACSAVIGPLLVLEREGGGLLHPLDTEAGRGGC
jgi:hypothetical protein